MMCKAAFKSGNGDRTFVRIAELYMLCVENPAEWYLAGHEKNLDSVRGGA
ncbi:hypothetical protein SAMN05444273_103529 [Litoreibacter ascidiaceicola]|uniref:Uncharacterized protein n=1 Tax=Litoreibacter ascidiaceicola TaxID=1486859 RepID=A0A1M4YFI6_9RHOB|nr:hypothetical protein [Litoreibacter ascidiaceicola]SHF04547.1 hypothetical protein SAMN05444273_103529 [Litoreibacter ascidiaceicola]